MKLRSKYIFFITGLIFLTNVGLFAQKDNIIEIGNLYEGEIEYSAFEITDESTIHIEGKVGGKFSENLVFYGWIIQSKTRELVLGFKRKF